MSKIKTRSPSFTWSFGFLAFHLHKIMLIVLEEALEVNKNVVQVALFSPTSKGLLHEEKYSICAL